MVVRMLRFHQQYAGACLDAQHRVDVGGRQRERLFAEHRLARLECGDRPARVETGRQRVVDRVDLGRVNQRLIVRISARDAVRRRIGVRARRIARGDAGEYRQARTSCLGSQQECLESFERQRTRHHFAS